MVYVSGHVSTEVSSTTLNSKLLKVKNYLINNPVMKHRQVALMNQDRRDSGTVSDVSRKSSSASQTSRKSSQVSGCVFAIITRRISGACKKKNKQKGTSMIFCREHS